MKQLIKTLDLAIAGTAQKNVEMISSILKAAAPLLGALELTKAELPWGRTLLHKDPAGKFNVQLDVFSAGYEGAIHSHGTWGMLWVIRGALQAWDYDFGPDGALLKSVSVLSAGSGYCFCPPDSDWHKVAALETGEQTASIHIYGEGFDLDTGTKLDEKGQPTTYQRGHLGDPEAVLPYLRRR